MPAFCKYDDALACKLVTAYPKNADKGLPSVQGTVLLFDSTTGKVCAVRRPVANNHIHESLKAK
jgi:ornithine cyclodeaminase/alanine dehydrogenase-like protein (mu-crystallin family)